MSKHAPLTVSVNKDIPAAAEVLYDLVSDITAMHRFSPENIAGVWLHGASSAIVGAQFKGTNKLGKAKWSTKPTVTVADRAKRFAFKVPGGAGPEWTYRFEPTENGTRVTESMCQRKASPFIIRFIQRRNGITDRASNLFDAMTLTLDRLAIEASPR